MMEDNLLQDRINELDSAIINFVDNKVYITGFYNPVRLTSYLEQDKKNWLPKGMYDKSAVTFSNIKSGALFLVQTDGQTIERYQFTVVFREPLQRSNKEGPIIVSARKNKFAEQWQVITEKTFFEFATQDEMNAHLQENYKIEIDLANYQKI